MPNHFDSVAGDWDKNQVHIKRTKAIAECFTEMVQTNKQMKALEFGAGTGLLSFALKDYFAEITLMDSSVEMIKATSEKLILTKDTHLIPVFFDLEKNNYSDKTFDVIFSQMVMHHVKDIDEMTAKFFTMLNPGGKLVIADLYTEDGSFHDFAFDGHNGFDPDKLAKVLQKKGFSNIKHQECFVITKEPAEKIKKKYPVFLLAVEK
jgi:tRNA (cmo5U34)-methyltransferase